MTNRPVSKFDTMVQTLVRDNVKLNNDVYKELKKVYARLRQNIPGNEKIPSEHQRVYVPYEKHSSSKIKKSQKEVISE
ncbi:T3SS effector EspX [Escherichia coli]|uniref:T3SS effector EspX n=1 Tax=Escherichia coli TaxID=562 RepID=A0A377CWC1_ECOLX|nr:T3SS effector EspX [Escherichia coli]